MPRRQVQRQRQRQDPGVNQEERHRQRVKEQQRKDRNDRAQRRNAVRENAQMQRDAQFRLNRRRQRISSSRFEIDEGMEDTEPEITNEFLRINQSIDDVQINNVEESLEFIDQLINAIPERSIIPPIYRYTDEELREELTSLSRELLIEPSQLQDDCYHLGLLIKTAFIRLATCDELTRIEGYEYLRHICVHIMSKHQQFLYSERELRSTLQSLIYGLPIVERKWKKMSSDRQIACQFHKIDI